MSMKYLSNPYRFVLPVFSSLLLLGCGGGSSSSPTAVLSDAQGRWRGTLSGISAGMEASTLVLPDGQAWMVYTASGGGRRLVHGNLRVDGSQLTGAAKIFDLDAGHVSGDVTWTANATARTQLVLSSSSDSLVGNFSSTSFLSQNNSDIRVAGVWRDSLSTPSISWSIESDGSLSGVGTGCYVSGAVSPRSDSVAVADVTLTETCTDKLTNAVTESSWNGVTLNQLALDNSENLRFTLIKSDKSQAFVLELTKAP